MKEPEVLIEVLVPRSVRDRIEERVRTTGVPLSQMIRDIASRRANGPKRDDAPEGSTKRRGWR